MYVGRSGGREPQVFDISGSVVAIVDKPRPSTVEAPPASSPALEVRVGALGGWFASGDFYLQDPTVPRTRGTVNAVTIGGFASVEVPVGAARIGAGLDVHVPLGELHVARTGDTETRVRPIPHIAAGLPWLQVALGWVFPYHPAGGLRGRVPLTERLDAHAMAWASPAFDRQRADDSVYEGGALFTAAAGVGLRF